MAIHVNCPHCGESYHFREELLGKKFRCRKCEAIVLVGLPPASSKGQNDPPGRATAKALPATSKMSSPVPRPGADNEVINHQSKDRFGRARGGKKQGVSPLTLIGIAAGAGAVLLAAAVILVILFRSRPTEPTPVAGLPDSPSRHPDKPSTPRPPIPKPDPLPTPADTPKESPPKPPTDTPKEPPPRPVPAEPAGTGTSGRGVYPYLLRSVAWLLVRHSSGAGSGTGSLVDRSNRLVLTNYHVIHGGLEIVAFFPAYDKGGKLIAERSTYLAPTRTRQADIIPAQVVASDAGRDLALVQLERVPDTIEALPIAQASVSPGEQVHSVGNPGSSGALWIYTAGNVRQIYKKRWLARGGGDLVLKLEAQVVETQAPINPGDSGGPLVNDRGELVGVTHGTSAQGQQMSLFIDQSEANDFIETYFKKNKGQWVRADRPLLAPAGGSAGVAQIADLVEKLKSTDAKVRAQGVQALGDLGPTARVALPDLIGALKDGNDLVRRLAADALTRVGTAGKSDLPLLKTALGESSPEVQLYALGALGRLGAEGQEALPAVVISLTARDARVREQAVRTTVLVGASSRREVLAAVDKTLQDPEKTVRVAAAEVLVRDLALTEADVPRLLALLQHSDWEVRGHGARGLGKVGAAAKEAAPTLLAVLKEASEPALRRALLEALSGVGAESKEMIPALQKALQDPDLDLRLGALDAVGKLGPGAKDLASDLLVKALKEADTRQPALAALTVLGSNAPRGLARTVVGYLTDKESRPQVLAALVALKPSGDEAVSAASRMMDLFAEEKRIEQRGKLADAIARLGKPVIPVVIKYLDNGDPLLRLGAAATLTQIGPPARPALSRLYVHMNTDSIVEVRKECAQAITRIQGGR